MPFASTLLRVGSVYSRQALGELLGYGVKALETGIFTPRRYSSVLLFITKRKTADMTAYVDELDGDDLHFDSQTKGRLDHKLIEHQRLGLEILVFSREHRQEHPGYGFRFEGCFNYVDHRPGQPNRFHLRRAESETLPVRTGDASGDSAVHRTAEHPRHFGILANMRTYDVEAASRALRVDTWSLPAGEVSIGDRLAFWRTRGPDGKRGIVALGEVTALPHVMEVPRESHRFWRPQIPGQPHRRVAYRYLNAPGLPLWLDEDRSGVLAQLTVSRAQGNKLYRISEEQWEALCGMAMGTAPIELAGTSPTAWVEGKHQKVHDEGGEVDATFHVDSRGGREASLVLESRGGSGDKARNVEYNRGLRLLLGRLAALRVEVLDALVDSAHVREVPDDRRRLVLDVAFPIQLSGHYDLDGLLKQIGAAQAEVGRAPGARGGGNRTKRLRLVLGLPEDAPADLGAVLASAIPPEHAERDRVAATDRPLVEDGPAKKTTATTEQVAAQVLAHLRTYGSLTQADATRMAGSPRGYRKLIRYLQESGEPLEAESTPRGTRWRLRERR